MANFCENCGSPLKEGQRFCENCGTPVKASVAAAPAADAGTTVAAAGTLAAGTIVNPEPSADMNTSQPAQEMPQEQPLQEIPQGQPVQQNLNAQNENAPGLGTDPQRNIPEPQQPAAQETAYTAGRSAAEQNTEPPAPVLPARQEEPTSDFNFSGNPVRGGTGPRYETDKDLKSMFLRYDNRLNRKRYFMRSLMLWFAVSVITKLLSLLAASLGISAIATLGDILAALSAIPGLMLIIRRLHDLNRPTWWCIGAIIPLVNFVFGIYLLFFKGTEGPNDYGPDPLEVPD